ncbi:NUDIX hydrolase [Arthrobacter sp. 260]|uniref:NUDIX hydrolase n=1 Tax=Arthrobacter sp. 260 TaxID=2735314 RepID=UPI001491C445|nr:NUDIX hydrolase [Arthrobacter sp. 260]NOJ58713.1 NUDIX hydrolase [Arthrobacter sp. 260]
MYGGVTYTDAANVSERQLQPPALAISTVIFALRPSVTSGRPTLWLPLVRRIRQPHLGKWALPGGPLAQIESLQDAASRNLKETTGLVPNYLEQLYAFGGLDRAATQRLVSIVYWALVQPDEAALTQESENVRWFRADKLEDLAFDHNSIVDYALWRLRSKMEYGSIAYHFLGETFTLAQVREVYEAVLDRHLDPANFRRQLRATPDITPTDEYLQGVRHRPPRLYRYTGTASTLGTQAAPTPASTTSSTAPTDQISRSLP